MCRKEAETHPKLILSTCGWMESGIAVRYLKVQCISLGTLQMHALGQSPLTGAAAAKKNRSLSSHLCRYEALWARTLIVPKIETSTLYPEPWSRLETQT